MCSFYLFSCAVITLFGVMDSMILLPMYRLNRGMKGITSIVQVALTLLKPSCAMVVAVVGVTRSL